MRISFILLTTILFAACTNHRPAAEHSHRFENNKWLQLQPVEFTASFNDTISEYKVEITVVHTEQYLFSNLIFSLLIITPDGGERNTDFEIFLKDDNGNFTGNQKDAAYYFVFDGLKRTSFFQKGTYIFRLQHHMPFDYIEGIEELNVKIFSLPNE
jgi:gliding motility-associated lipoprotein GldH